MFLFTMSMYCYWCKMSFYVINGIFHITNIDMDYTIIMYASCSARGSNINVRIKHNIESIFNLVATLVQVQQSKLDAVWVERTTTIHYN